MSDLEKFKVFNANEKDQLLNLLYEDVKLEVLGLEDLLKLPLSKDFKQSSTLEKYQYQSKENETRDMKYK